MGRLWLTNRRREAAPAAIAVLNLRSEAYLGGADKYFGADGKLANDGTPNFWKGFMQAYASWRDANSK
jgi:hypothetical protein